MAIWQTGITWAPSAELLNTDFNGVLAHVARHFASWTRRLARAVTRHKRDPATQEARTRSGDAPGRHGLTRQLEWDRDARARARRDYYWTLDLQNQLTASKGKGKGNVRPKSYDEMSACERWWLRELWERKLRRAMDEAEARCHRLQAPYFTIGERDE